MEGRKWTANGRQQLLELIYDLLPASEAAELRERIRSDPAWAAAYAEAQATARLLAEAARLPPAPCRFATLASRPVAGKAAVATGGRPHGPTVGQGPNASGRLARAGQLDRGGRRRAIGAVLGRRVSLAPRTTGGDRRRAAPPVCRGPFDAPGRDRRPIHRSTTTMGGRPLPAQVEVALSAAGNGD